MRLKALAVLAAVALAGCGGDDSEETDQAQQQPEQTTKQKTTEPEKLVGKRTRENVLRTLGLTKSGENYVFPGAGCQVVEVAIDKKAVKKLEDSVDDPQTIIKNESGSAAVQLTEVKYFCAIQAANRLKRIP
jgi:hypothetical protein